MDNSTISISQLKVNPADAISLSTEQPIGITSHNKTKAYLIGKDIYEKLIELLEDQIDQKAVEESETEDVVDFEEIAKSLKI